MIGSFLSCLKNQGRIVRFLSAESKLFTDILLPAVVLLMIIHYKNEFFLKEITITC